MRDARREEDERRVADTFRVISLSFSNLGGPESARPSTSRTNGQRAYEDRIYQNFGEFYLDKLRYDDAAAVYDSFVELYPYHRASPELQHARDRDLRGRRLPEARGRVEEGVRDEVRTCRPNTGSTSTSAESPEVLGYLKTNLKDLANHYHAQYQDAGARGGEAGQLRRGARLVPRVPRLVPEDPQSPPINYQLADLLLENDDFGEAAREYERTAYDYPSHERAAAAGYAAIFAHREHLKLAGADQRRRSSSARPSTSSLKFADTFPEHEHAAVVLGAAAEDLYEMKDFAAAATAGARRSSSATRTPSRRCAARRGSSSRTRRSSSPITRPPSPRTRACSS